MQEQFSTFPAIVNGVQRQLRGGTRAEDPDVERVRERLLALTFPRLHMMLVVSLAGAGAFLTSVLLVQFGMDSMALRYALAAVAGYLLFLGLLRLWLLRQERELVEQNTDVDVDLDFSGSSPGDGFEGGGGSFGGSGASGSFDPAHSDGIADSPVADALEAADFDDGWIIVVVVVALGSGLVAIGYVVYASPLLFAELLLDAAVAGALYRGVRRRERAHWMRGVLRRTALSAAVLCAAVAVAGFLLQAVFPEAHTLGDILRTLRA